MPGNDSWLGLSRDIPDPIKRVVRQECGFGCVICGCAIYHYAHFGIPFRDATEHDPKQMALLCEPHHRDFDTRVRPMEELVRARQEPFCLREGCVRRDFSYAGRELIVALGDATFMYPRSILRIHGHEVLVA